jgi:hypothetical protein
MTPELEIQLVQQFPEFFKDYLGDPKKTAMSFGIQTDDGWFDLIKQAAARLTFQTSQLPEDERGEYRASTIKEKFGGLIIYMTKSTPKMLDICEDILKKSRKTCEVCSAFGKLVDFNGCVKTVCSTCEAKIIASEKDGQKQD